jgi:hypothetical protein
VTAESACFDKMKPRNYKFGTDFGLFLFPLLQNGPRTYNTLYVERHGASSPVLYKFRIKDKNCRINLRLTNKLCPKDPFVCRVFHTETIFPVIKNIFSSTNNR